MQVNLGVDFQSLTSSITLDILFQACLMLKEQHMKPDLFCPFEHLIVHEQNTP